MEIKDETITVRDLIDLRKNGMLKVNAEYQRAAVWTESQQKKLIDSVMRCYPLPLFYFHHKVTNVAGMRSEGLEIVDGQRRINALYTARLFKGGQGWDGCCTVRRSTLKSSISLESKSATRSVLPSSVRRSSRGKCPTSTVPSTAAAPP